MLKLFYPISIVLYPYRFSVVLIFGVWLDHWKMLCLYLMASCMSQNWQSFICHRWPLPLTRNELAVFITCPLTGRYVAAAAVEDTPLSTVLDGWHNVFLVVDCLIINFHETHIEVLLVVCKSQPRLVFLSCNFWFPVTQIWM